jgi:hypothetical protein
VTGVDGVAGSSAAAAAFGVAPVVVTAFFVFR